MAGGGGMGVGGEWGGGERWIREVEKEKERWGVGMGRGGERGRWGGREEK